MNKKKLNRKKKFERLNIYFSWLNRDQSQLYITEKQWKKLYYLRLKNEINKRYYINDEESNNKEVNNEEIKIYEYLNQFELEYIKRAYKKRKSINYSSKKMYYKYDVKVKIGNKFFNPIIILKYLNEN